MRAAQPGRQILSLPGHEVGLRWSQNRPGSSTIMLTVCGGNRTRHGADTQQVLASVVRTARQRHLDLPPLIATMLRATGPVVPDAFGLPPPPA